MRRDVLFTVSALVLFAAPATQLRAQSTPTTATASTDGAISATTQAPPQDPPPQTTVTPDEPSEGRLKAAARRMGSMASPDENPESGFFATGGIIVAGSSLAGGAGYRRMDLFGSRFDAEVEGMLSIRRYQDYRIAFGMLDSRTSTLEFDVADGKITSLFNASAHKAPGTALYVEMRYRDYPQHNYYGTGIDAREEDRSDYALRGTSIEGVWQWQLASSFGVSARAGWLKLDVGPGRQDSLLNLEQRFVGAALPAGALQPHFATFGAGMVFDTRREPGAPDNGRWIGFSVRRFAASSMPEHSFTRVTLDARTYHRPLSARGVVAARALISTDVTRDNGATPFYLQQSLGGGETLRGFHSYRFPDQSLAHASVEYRWRAHRFIELVPFFDVGTVAPGLSRLSLGSLKVSPGVGIRGRTDRRAIARLDWAHGSDGHRLVVGVGPVF
jgi:outer membrane protein assembly factor BamA